MDTLPRFRLPDESAGHDAVTTRLLPSSEFDDLESMTTRVRERAPAGEEPFDAAPTKVRPALGRLLMVRSRRELDLRRAKNDAPVEDLVEELRAAAAGRNARVRELPSSELLPDASGARDEVHDVDVSELMFDRAVPAREVWNVREAAPRAPMVTALIEPRSSSRFVMTAALATFIGAVLALGAALLAWRMSGLSF
ncbi:MAG TPA: hypothetical protein VLM85_00845 [Polyangiaceae bacterium]|nr:hypothetical protein [Polyangiaceae bacterium]